jgi:hypothetical protein
MMKWNQLVVRHVHLDLMLLQRPPLIALSVLLVLTLSLQAPVLVRNVLQVDILLSVVRMSVSNVPQELLRVQVHLSASHVLSEKRLVSQTKPYVRCVLPALMVLWCNL